MSIPSMGMGYHRPGSKPKVVNPPSPESSNTTTRSQLWRDF